MSVAEQRYLKLAWSEPNQWELHCGRLRRRPPMSADHNRLASRLFSRLVQQLDQKEFDVRIGMGQLRRSSESYYIPDVYVIPMELVRPQLGRHTLEVYEAPLPLVVEVWSPSTGGYDVHSKLPEYQARGDHEIWLIHPDERTLKAWRRQPDGTYEETQYVGGAVQPVALPNVSIHLDELFD